MKIGGRSFIALGPAGGAAPPSKRTIGGVTTQIRNITGKRKIDALVVNAGLGGAFGLLMGAALVRFIGLSTLDKFRELLVIAVVGAIVVKFIEPIAEHLREALHIAYSRPPAAMGLSIKLYAVLVVAGISLADGMLHSLFMENTADTVGTALGYTISGLIPAGITYFWLRGTQSRPSRAQLYGPASALVIVPAYLGLLLLITRMQSIGALIVPSTISWALIALAGGLAIDNGWGRHPTRGILLSTVACCVLVELAFCVYHLSTGNATISQLVEMLIREVGRTVGWGVALMLYPGANSCFAPAQAAISGSQVSATFAPKRTG